MAVRPRDEDWGTFHAGSHHSSPHGVWYDIYGKDGSTFRAWEVTSPYPPFRGSYGFNTTALIDPPVLLPPRVPSRNPIKIDLFSIRGRANIPALLDSTVPGGTFHEFSGPPTASRSSTNFCINRHNVHVNCLFMDWLVRKVGLKELWTLK
jgi:hypothetical protein